MISKLFDDRLLFVQWSTALVILWHIANSFVDTGYITATILTFLTIAFILIFVIRQKDPMISHIFIFSLVAGIVELSGDFWLVEVIQKLEYDPNGPFVVASPLYMPFAWSAILFQFSYMIWYMLEQKEVSFFLTIAIAAVIGGVCIPIYEHCAHGAGWWSYVDTPMFGRAPYFIILGEIFILTILPPVLLLISQKRLFSTILTGIIFGLWIGFSFWLGYTIIGG